MSTDDSKSNSNVPPSDCDASEDCSLEENSTGKVTNQSEMIDSNQVVSQDTPDETVSGAGISAESKVDESTEKNSSLEVDADTEADSTEKLAHDEAEKQQKEAAELLQGLIKQEEKKLEEMIKTLEESQEKMPVGVASEPDQKENEEKKNVTLESMLLKDKLQDPLQAMEKIQKSYQANIELLLGKIDLNMSDKQNSSSDEDKE